MTWVKHRHGIWRWDGPRPIDDEADLTGAELVEHRTLRRVMSTLEHNLTATPRTTPVRGVICSDCGCLCKPDESCLGCLVWAERNVVEMSWLAPFDVAPIEEMAA